MTVIVCISEGGGMLFNKRRQSRDKAVIKDIAEISADSVLFISDFSAKLLAESDISAIAVSNPLDSAGDEDAVFVENLPITAFKKKIDRFIIYKWNQKYPTDTRLDFDPQKEGMSLIESIDFVGNAHEKITRETWMRTDYSLLPN